MFLKMHWKNSKHLGFRGLTKSIETIKLCKRIFSVVILCVFIFLCSNLARISFLWLCYRLLDSYFNENVLCQKGLNRFYIKRFVWYNLYDSQLVLKCVCTIIHVVHTEFKKVVLPENSAFKNSSKMIRKQAAALIIIALISEKNKLREKRKKGRVCVKLWLKSRKKLEFYETLLAKCG